MTIASEPILLQSITAQCRLASPLGTSLLARTGRGLAGAWFERQKHHPAQIDAPERDDERAARRSGTAAATLLRRRESRLRRSARPSGHRVPACGVARPAAHRAGRDVELRRDRAIARRAIGEPRRRRRGRPQSGLDHRALPPRRRHLRRADRLCRRARPQGVAVADRGRAPRSRTWQRAAASSIEETRPRRARRPRRTLGRCVPLHADRSAGVRTGRARLPSPRRRRAPARSLLAARGELASLRAHWRTIAVVGVPTRRCRSSASPTRRCRSPPACRRSSTR